jgi:SHS family lactate transporter-like MFS transporter
MPTIAQQRRTILTCFLGWTLDAFDFFVMIFLITDLATAFHVGVTAITWAVTATLVLRVVGAAFFGRLADRFGRKPILIINVLAFSAVELATGFSTTLTMFLVLRAIFGIAMGGQWGVAASLTMESIPAHWRGLASGLLQSGYSVGYLLAGVYYGFAHDLLGWRGMFIVAVVPSLLVIALASSLPESPVWKQQRVTKPAGLVTVIRANWKLFLYAMILMTAAAIMSHGTQDLYPVMLKVQHKLSVHQVATISTIYNIGGLLGCLCGGMLSQKIGRRRELILASAAMLVLMPFWGLCSSLIAVTVTAFFMQFLVQCNFGVMPAHLNEMSPAAVRGTFPGFALQFGNMLAAGNATIQSMLADSLHKNYGVALSLVAGLGAIAFCLLAYFGPDARNAKMGDEVTPSPIAVAAHA